MENCIFCKIINNKISSFKILENEEFLAFLSISPINPGHTLVIPKKHTDYFFDLEDQILNKILIFSKPIAVALKNAFNPQTGRIGIMIAGMGVPHAHVHLIPIDQEGDLNFARSKHNVSQEELLENQKKIVIQIKH